MAALQTVVRPSHALASQPFWPELHRTILSSYRDKRWTAFPSSWTRLDRDPTRAAQGLAHELGPNGYMAVILLDQIPVACGGVFPWPCYDSFWGSNFETLRAPSGRFETDPGVTITPASTQPEKPDLTSLPPVSSKQWELCCFCVCPEHRQHQLGKKLVEALIQHVRTHGAQRLYLNYIVEETGTYWPRLGFDKIPGLGGVLAKGWTHTEGVEGLLSDIHFAWGVQDV